MAARKDYEKVKQRLCATARLLASQKHASHRTKVEERQADLIIEGMPTLTILEGAELSAIVNNANFSQKIEEMILDRIIMVSNKEEDQIGAEAKHQSYASIGNYFTAEVWHSCGGNPEEIINHAIGLGLRNPDEPTVALITF